MTRSRAVAAVLLVATLPGAAAAEPSGIETLPPAIRARVTCSIQAAARFAMPTNLLIAVAEQEGGRVGQWVKNANGSYDVGPMQFNTSYLRSLERFGITAQDVAAPGCYPYELAAWRLRRHILRDRGDLWKRAANYHSGTPARNAHYRAGLRQRAVKWGSWLAEHAPTARIAHAASPIDHAESPYVPEPPPAPPPRSTDIVATIVERRSARRSNESSRAPSHKAEQRPRRATPDPAPTNTKPSLLEELATIDAHRRAGLLELVSGPQPLAGAAR